ncbi:DNA polymerase III subunit chi [Prosthecomicrobium pneumaticum]|uniref:DNA polymerase-3 subunit chi n=1 Tax=Prosthecomicrobium pneumaticum TaxID=81895 RepID=A0A7W9CTW8_9HYPH|nr:DNA polymerase III subunit chi [Prosthecomicrobium pneumaticum]MBB5751476.1 DNA polymerase-3 subunit chi [Prosthecomicrobium pneumaticum]
MTEVFFYHLQKQSLEAVLPGLLEKAIERGWRVVVEAGSRERLEALDAHLWTYREDSFLPHGTAGDAQAALQPILLTTAPDNPYGAAVRFLVDGAPFASAEGYERLVVIFDGNDRDALAAARDAWKRAKAAGHDSTYWQQSERGRWERKA